MDVTTIKLAKDTKQELDSYREHAGESYDEVIHKMLFIVKNVKSNPKLSKQTIEAIESARKRIKAGNYLTEEEAKRRLGL